MYPIAEMSIKKQNKKEARVHVFFDYGKEITFSMPMKLLDPDHVIFLQDLDGGRWIITYHNEVKKIVMEYLDSMFTEMITHFKIEK